MPEKCSLTPLKKKLKKTPRLSAYAIKLIKKSCNKDYPEVPEKIMRIISLICPLIINTTLNMEIISWKCPYVLQIIFSPGKIIAYQYHFKNWVLYFLSTFSTHAMQLPL